MVHRQPKKVLVRAIFIASLTLIVAACNLGAAPANETPIDITEEPTQTGVAPTRTLLPTGNPPTSIPVTAITLPNQNQEQSTQVVQLPATSVVRFPTNTPTPISILILSPIPGNVVSGNVQVLGSAIHPQFLQYRLEYGPDPNPSNLWFPITGIVQTPILTGTLGIWNTTTSASPDGLYQLRLRVFLRDGSQQTTVVNNVRVQNQAPTPVPTNTPTTPRPIAAFTQDYTSGFAPLVVRFTNQSQGQITSYAWDFGGDGSSNAQNPFHTFTQPGVYNVALTVIGPGGRSNVSRQINVQSATAPVAAFVANPNSGESPLPVSFSNQSTGNITSYEWDFGDGNTSNEVNPSHTFTDVGTYNVILDAIGPGGTSTVVRQITVENPAIEAPQASFAASPTSGEVPLTVSFSNNTSGEVDQYLWDFDGDGITDSIDEAPTHIYEDSGVFEVRLTAIGPGGQSNTTAEIIVQQPPDAPVAAFTPSTTSGDAPLAVTFSNETTGDATDFVWDFNNDGQPDSTETSPTFTYSDPGTYIVKLTANGVGGSTTAEQTLTVTQALVAPIAGFDADPTAGEAPLSVVFTNTSQGEQIAYQWDFDGDGITDSTDSNPTFEYTEPGNYTSTLTVVNDAGSDSISTQINVSEAVVIAPPASAFTANPQAGTAPLTVSFMDESVGDINTYEWDFNNDGLVDSTEQNPTTEFTTSGTYTVTLTVSGPGGEDSIATQISVSESLSPPIAGFTVDVSTGTAPLTVNFTNTSQGEQLTYAWDFGDGIGTSTDPDPSYQYVTPGSYTVMLTVTNPAGSDSIAAQIEVTDALAAPIAGFTVDVSTGTAPLIINFTNTSQGEQLTYAWDFGDGVGTSTDPDPSYQYVTPGSYTVMLTVTNPAGSDSIAAQIEVTDALAAPIAGFTVDVSTGTAPLTVNFTNTSQGEQLTYAWDFGDGVGTSTDPNPSYQYVTPGSYTVMLTVTNPAGSDSNSESVEVLAAQEPPVAGFTADTLSGDAPLSVNFTNTSTGTIDSFGWDFNSDGVTDSTDANTLFVFNDPGSYTVTLTVMGPAGQDVTSQTVTVNQSAPQLPTGNIAFVSDRDGNNEIYVINSDGTGAVNITNNPANDREPTWSPDGSKIAFVSDRDGNNEIYVVDINDVSNVMRLTDNAASDLQPAWSPDGSKIAFVSDREGDNDIHVMNQNGSDQIQISFDVSNENSPDWSPDNSKIVYVSDVNGNNDIFTMNAADGSEITQLTVDPSNDRQPVWSPNGNFIAYVTDLLGDNDVYTMNIDGSNPKQITIDVSNDQQPDWSPDSNQLIFVSDRNTNENNLYILNANDGSNLIQVNTETSNDQSPAWKP